MKKQAKKRVAKKSSARAAPRSKSARKELSISLASRTGEAGFNVAKAILDAIPSMTFADVDAATLSALDRLFASCRRLVNWTQECGRFGGQQNPPIKLPVTVSTAAPVLPPEPVTNPEPHRVTTLARAEQVLREMQHFDGETPVSRGFEAIVKRMRAESPEISHELIKEASDFLEGAFGRASEVGDRPAWVNKIHSIWTRLDSGAEVSGDSWHPSLAAPAAPAAPVGGAA